MVTRKRAFVFLVLAAFCSMLLCSSGAFAEPSGEPVVVGSIWSQVGVAAPLGQAGLRGSQLAVKVINQEGGIFGHPLVLKNIDGQSDTTVISNAALRLVEEEEVLAGCGLTDDSLVSAAGPIFQTNDTVFLVGTATTPTIPRIGDYIFMVPFGDNDQGRAVAKYCADVLGWKKVAVFWDNASAYSLDLTKFFMEAFQEYTGDENAVVHQEMLSDRGRQLYRSDYPDEDEDGEGENRRPGYHASLSSGWPHHRQAGSQAGSTTAHGLHGWSG